ncbi:hypothetical protein Tco_1299012, partial [Tanacetum coccineum]
MALKSIEAIGHDKREELRKKGIKSPSKFLSPKYLSPASIKELNKNPSALKCVHFVNSMVILSTESDTNKEDTSSTSTHKHELDDMVKRSKEIKEQGKEEDGMETDMEVEEVIEEEESEFETDEEVEEVFKEEEEDGDEENFNLFPTMMDHHLGEMVFEKPFIDETGLVYSEEIGTVMFKQGDEKITFTMPYTMEVFMQTWLMGLSTNSIPPSPHEEKFGHGRLYLMRRSLEVLKKFYWMILGGR